MAQEEPSTKSEATERVTWQDFVDVHLMREMDGMWPSAAAILGLDGNIWAQSQSFPQFKLEEFDAIREALMNRELLREFYFRGTKYRDPGEGISFHGVTLEGITFERTKRTMIIVVYEEPMFPDECKEIINRLCRYLRVNGY